MLVHISCECDYSCPLWALRRFVREIERQFIVTINLKLALVRFMGISAALCITLKIFTDPSWAKSAGTNFWTTRFGRFFQVLMLSNGERFLSSLLKPSRFRHPSPKSFRDWWNRECLCPVAISNEKVCFFRWFDFSEFYPSNRNRYRAVSQWFSINFHWWEEWKVHWCTYRTEHGNGICCIEKPWKVCDI